MQQVLVASLIESVEAKMYRTIETSIWSDPAFRSLPSNGKLLFIYLITNQHTHVSGIYYLPIILVALETGLNASEIDTLLDTLSATCLCLRDSKTDVIWVVNMFRYQGVGKRNHQAAANHLPTLHKSCLIKEFLDKYPAVKKYYKHRVSDRVSEFGTQEQEQEQDILIPAASAGCGNGKSKPQTAQPSKRESTAKPTSDHAAFVDYFVTRWQDQYGAKYLFQTKDGAAASKLLKAAGNLERARRLIDIFLADTTRFIADQRHPLTMLLNQVNKFLPELEGTTRIISDPDHFVAVHPTADELPWNRGGK